VTPAVDIPHNMLDLLKALPAYLPVNHPFAELCNFATKKIAQFIFFYFIIYMCIQGLGHFSTLPPPPPLPPTPPPPSPLYPLNTQQNLYCPYL
jgi:hypothetical protein